MTDQQRWQRMIDWYGEIDGQEPQTMILSNDDGTYRMAYRLSNGRVVSHPVFLQGERHD